MRARSGRQSSGSSGSPTVQRRCTYIFASTASDTRGSDGLHTLLLQDVPTFGRSPSCTPLYISSPPTPLSLDICRHARATTANPPLFPSLLISMHAPRLCALQSCPHWRCALCVQSPQTSDPTTRTSSRAARAGVRTHRNRSCRKLPQFPLLPSLRIRPYAPFTFLECISCRVLSLSIFVRRPRRVNDRN